MGVSENVVYPIVPNGFADHYPYEKWLFHWEYTQHFQTNAISMDSCACSASQSSHWLVVDRKTHGFLYVFVPTQPWIQRWQTTLATWKTDDLKPPATDLHLWSPKSASLWAAKGQTVTTLSLHHLEKSTGYRRTPLQRSVSENAIYPWNGFSCGFGRTPFQRTQLDRHFTRVLRHSHLHLNPGSMDGKSLKRTLRSSAGSRKTCACWIQQ